MSKRGHAVETDSSGDESESTDSEDELLHHTDTEEELPDVLGGSEDMFLGMEIYTGMESENEDMVEDVIEESSLQSLLTLPTPVPPTQAAWIWTKGGNEKLAADFDEENSGWNVDFDVETTEFEFLQKTFPEQVIEKTVQEINRYADSEIATTGVLSRRQKLWKPINTNEFMRFLCIRILMGIDKKPQFSHYWSSDPMFQSTLIPKIMTSNRFFELQRYLHFSNNSDQQPGDRLHKIREVWSLFNLRWSELLDPSQDLSVDESLIKFKGRLSWKQFIPTKRNRFGIKTFSVVDAKSGFVLSSKIYAGKGREDLKYDMKLDQLIRWKRFERKVEYQRTNLKQY